MLEVAAGSGAHVVAMHNQRGHEYGDIIADICAFLRRSLELADDAGIGRERVIVDPGFGFGKTPEQNLEVLRRLAELKALERPILIGTSRKSMIGHVLGDSDPADRVEGHGGDRGARHRVWRGHRSRARRARDGARGANGRRRGAAGA